MTQTSEQLQTKIAELEAENAKLHEQVDLQVPKMAFTQLKAELAAAQEENGRLENQVLARDAEDCRTEIAALKAERDAVNTIAKRQSAILTRTGDDLADCRTEIAALKAERDTRIAQLERQRDELLAENKQLREDAERYRVLRDSEYQLDEDDPSVSDSFFNQYFGEELDAAVDELKSRFDSTIASSKGEQ